MAWHLAVTLSLALGGFVLLIQPLAFWLLCGIAALVAYRLRDCSQRFERAMVDVPQHREPSMKWVTRERPKVDRIACPWLIKRFVDPEAEFLYVPGDQVTAVAERENATPYDVPGAELGHHGDECSFDAIVKKYDLARDDPALARLALIVRGADAGQPDLTPESRGLIAVAQGFSAAYEDDNQQLAAELPVYDALYAWCQSQSSAR
jgi:hypothetical protein